MGTSAPGIWLPAHGSPVGRRIIPDFGNGNGLGLEVWWVGDPASSILDPVSGWGVGRATSDGRAGGRARDPSPLYGVTKAIMERMVLRLALVVVVVLFATIAGADDPWVIVDDVVITEPTKVGDVIVLLDGSLTVTGVPEPGLEVEGNLWVIGSGEVVLEDSVIQFLSTHHGQYALAAVDNARVEVTGCDYRVPNGVQHGLVVAGNAELQVEDTDFGDVQRVAAHTSRLEAHRLNGRFEVIVQNDAAMVLSDIPRDPDAGALWVWVEFPEGSEAVYTPPMPGYVADWSFPPQESTGIDQTVRLERCEAMLWPMLVREGSRLELRDIPDDNWIVVGLHLFESTVVEGLRNQSRYPDEELEIGRHSIRLVNASIDTWNLYPQGHALVRVRDSTLGEILAMGSPQVVVDGSTIDGSGGFLGTRDRSTMVLANSTVTCTVEAAHDSTLELHHSVVEPYPQDLTGAWTRFGAFDRARLYAHQTPVTTTPVLGGDGLIAASYIVDPPTEPPSTGSPASLFGSAAQFSLEGGPAPGRWWLQAVSPMTGEVEQIAAGEGNVEEDVLGNWEGANPAVSYRLQVSLEDAWGRTLTGEYSVRGTGVPLRPAPDRREP